jgi:Tol biopolymer transport system component
MRWSTLLALGMCCVHCAAPEERPAAPPDAGTLPPHATSASAGTLDAAGLPVATDATAAGGVADAALSSTSDCVAKDLPIVFVSTSAPPAIEYELYVMSLDARKVRQIGRGGHFQNPVWAPDGNSIAFRHRAPGSEITSFVGLIAADGSQSVVLTQTDTYPFVADPLGSPDGPSWSPDGQTIAYVSQRESNMWRIWLMSRFGGQPRLLLPESTQPQLYVSWSRHAAGLLAYVESSETGSDIWQVDLADTNLRENLSRGRVSQPTSPRWSPDGSRLAFAALDTRGADAGGSDTEIFVLSIASGEITQLTDDDALDQHPTWSPDGQHLLYSSARTWVGIGYRTNFWMLTLDGSEPPRQITRTTREHEPDWYGGSCATPG